MTHYEEIIALRQELKKPGIFRHNHIQMRMLVWHLTICCSVFFKRFMDIILAIHFIILNFVNSKEYPAKEYLLSDESYIDVIERAQKRVLDPYFNAINGDGHTVFTKENLFPLYV